MEDNNCSICLEKLTDNKKFLPCFHCFHTKCIDKWLKNSNKCPICKTAINHFDNDHEKSSDDNSSDDVLSTNDDSDDDSDDDSSDDMMRELGRLNTYLMENMQLQIAYQIPFRNHRTHGNIFDRTIRFNVNTYNDSDDKSNTEKNIQTNNETTRKKVLEATNKRFKHKKK